MEEIRLYSAKSLPKEQVMQFRQDFFSAGERSINGSRGLHHYEKHEDWLGLLEECEKPNNTKIGVQTDTYLAVRTADNKIIGCIEFRHTLNEALAVIGGHIGYSVAPAERRKGYATEMLRQVLVEAKAIGLHKVLLTCDTDNIASCKTIERCEGYKEQDEPFVLEEEVFYRYWIELEKNDA